MRTVAFHTLGCKVNQYETEAMEELFEKNNYSIVNENDIADIYVINTCTVTNLSDRKSRQFIRKAKRLNKNGVIAVVGCYSQVSPSEVEKIDGVDVIIGTSDRRRIVELCERAMDTNEIINVVQNIKTYKKFEKIDIDDIKSKTRAYIKIQDGCNQFCSYCIIPYARGPIRSRAIDDIIEETKKLSHAGFKEVILTGIHVASYGRDLKNIQLIDIIEQIGNIDGIERIRLSSVEPTLINEEFMKSIARVGKVCDHFHLSLQSGSNSVLKRMNRKYTSEIYKEKVELIRKYMPDAGITTDIIVGFPGETDEEFKETCDFVNEIKFSRIHVFKYSPRKGTPAAKYPDQIDGNVKNERSDKLIELGNKLAFEFMNRFKDRNLDVLFEEANKNNIDLHEGYTTNYIRVAANSNISIIGEIKSTRIVDIQNDLLIGEILH
ncbi:tRNA (N(6)-L-threonylcarbamoyladenosine(37)-C(2))-methylthiotransferase MtaB [Paratissierella segnis]|jgi:threonylcarbamoyladenosine tRNA methylthiotransferase MtaB|uniref:Threonylcarbamoyladenosine tRNA methylthiotransferase MtaB n=1 Tax=Paratissierella segnis TaxID=2763679 RepID=A0A926ET50_9FIRM|nr:tRNA (N(6)-L-threonylcarbamoyladenosine(37)-C(2))-methylthiotransferase MtaB [Paratissierella segnis]MBC8588386.1 tRNA (N(6)-L-threonylcarbamoyladenosine(37)-C(2))-methylthiotransferase MtaB [Paratissierella segnis]